MSDAAVSVGEVWVTYIPPTAEDEVGSAWKSEVLIVFVAPDDAGYFAFRVVQQDPDRMSSEPYWVEVLEGRDDVRRYVECDELLPLYPQTLVPGGQIGSAEDGCIRELAKRVPGVLAGTKYAELSPFVVRELEALFR